jgi:hypothetical protein
VRTCNTDRTQAALQGFDPELRVITWRNGRFCAQSREFTHSDALCPAKCNKLTVESHGTMLAEVISAEQTSKTRLLVFECATMREDGMSERLQDRYLHSPFQVGDEPLEPERLPDAKQT